ncbi:hypothetical protein WMY93_015129 [Mugilogobius chulae]|uniref:Uncharacterized protein n=1 Tax=Mugilogobius chulae TaxID=88201 RepID=A0AAW0P8M7_9GOBI
MTHELFEGDETKYIIYYVSQAGGELPGYSGSRVQYGSGIGGLLRGLLRWAYPLVSRGLLRKNQDGNGLVVFTKKAVKRPPARRVPKTTTKKRKRRSTVRRVTFPTQRPDKGGQH